MPFLAAHQEVDEYSVAPFRQAFASRFPASGEKEPPRNGQVIFLFTNMSKEIHLLPFMEPGRVEAGCDEAGRGPLAGPVYAAAVILPPDFHHPLLNDSKKMSEKSRETLRPVIEREAVAWAVEAVSPEEIDNLNILGPLSPVCRELSAGWIQGRISC